MAHGSLAVPKAMVTREGRNGAQYSLYGPLLPLVSLPAYKLTSWGEGSSSGPGAPEISWADMAALGTNQWICALLASLMFEMALFWGVPLWRAVGVSILTAFTTMLLPYSRDYFTQPLAALCVLSAFVGLRQSSAAGTLKGLVLSSFMIGAAVLTRMDMLVMVPGFLLSGLLALSQSRVGITQRSLGLLMIPLFSCLAGLILFDWYRWGAWLTTPYTRMPFSTPLIDSLPRFLWSHDLSLFLFNPLLIPSFFLMAFTWKEERWLWSGILLSSVSYLLLIASYVDYHGGVCPGPRYLLVLVPLNLLPLLRGLGRLSIRNWATVGVLVVCGFVGLMLNGYAALVDYSQAVPAWDFWKSFLHR